MNTVLRRSAAAMLVASFVALVTLLDVRTASSQPTCVVTTITNLTGCNVNLCLYDAFGTVNCYAAPPGNTGIVLGAFNPIGVRSPAGILHPFVAPPTPGCTNCFAVAPAAACCAIVCYDQASCRIRITPCGPACSL